MGSKSLPSKSYAAESSEDRIMVRVRFLMHLRDLFGTRERGVSLRSGSTVGSLLIYLGDTVERRAALLAGTQVNAHVVVLKNGTPIRGEEGLAEVLADGDTVAIAPFVAGG
jgi:molybdopterin converting factor small subunit